MAVTGVGADRPSPCILHRLPLQPRRIRRRPCLLTFNRIKGALTTPVRVRIDDGKIRFYTETVAHVGPTFKELTVNFDLRNGPVPGAGMTHQEFLSMVTPKELYGSGGIKPLEMLRMGPGQPCGLVGHSQALQGTQRND